VVRQDPDVDERDVHGGLLSGQRTPPDGAGADASHGVRARAVAHGRPRQTALKRTAPARAGPWSGHENEIDVLTPLAPTILTDLASELENGRECSVEPELDRARSAGFLVALRVLLPAEVLAQPADRGEVVRRLIVVGREGLEVRPREVRPHLVR